jgi:hypothetical protein
VILAKELKSLVRWRLAFTSEGIESFLPCRHAGLMIHAVTNSMPMRSDSIATCYITPLVAESTSEDAMAFKPNYGRDRAERARAARAKSEEKQRKKDEKTVLRKAERADAEPPPEEINPPPDERQN